MLQLQSTVESCQSEIVSLVSHLEYLKQQAEREDSLLCDMNGAVRTEESSFSVEAAEMVTDCDDIDHMN